MKSQIYLPKHILLFYTGTLISNIGGFTFSISAMVYLAKANYSIGVIGLFIAISRLTGVLSNLIFGDLADRFSPKKYLIGAELFGLIMSAGILWAWQQGREMFSVFFFLAILRSGVLALQQGSRAKLTKSFSENNLSSQLRSAVWLNKVTQGASVFGALLSFFAVQTVSFDWIIGFDAATYLLNGILLLSIPDADPTWSAHTSLPTDSILSKFRMFYSCSPRVAKLDFLNYFALTGVNVWLVRVAGHNETWIPLLVGISGVTLWIGGLIARCHYFNFIHEWIWISLAVGWAGIGLLTGHSSFVLVLIPFTLQRLAFWTLSNRYAGEIQHAAPHGNVAAIVSARNVQGTVLFALGDITVGFFDYFHSSAAFILDVSWRVLLCLTVALFMVVSRRGFNAQKGASTG
jgi:MFS family permease